MTSIDWIYTKLSSVFFDVILIHAIFIWSVSEVSKSQKPFFIDNIFMFVQIRIFQSIFYSFVMVNFYFLFNGHSQIVFFLIVKCCIALYRLSLYHFYENSASGLVENTSHFIALSSLSSLLARFTWSPVLFRELLTLSTLLSSEIFLNSKSRLLEVHNGSWTWKACSFYLRCSVVFIKFSFPSKASLSLMLGDWTCLSNSPTFYRRKMFRECWVKCWIVWLEHNGHSTLDWEVRGRVQQTCLGQEAVEMGRPLP